jgi:hypothetical protein
MELTLLGEGAVMIRVSMKLVRNCLSPLVLAIGAAVIPGDLTASEIEGDYLYKVSLVRAAPGQLLELIELIKTNQPAGEKDEAGDLGPFMMRHSQGDQWDILLMYAAGDYASYFAEKRNLARAAASTFRTRFDALAAFREDMFAFGPGLDTVRVAFAENDFYHVEIFNARPGKHEDLLEERRMENTYLINIGRRANMIWRVDQGSDADSFTIGFYKSLQDYAAPAKVTDSEERNRIAIAAGFKGRDFIGIYLRELISSHHDTLAVRVR